MGQGNEVEWMKKFKDSFDKEFQETKQMLENSYSSVSAATTNHIIDDTVYTHEIIPSIIQHSRRIVAAAINVEGLIVSMPKPARHGDIIKALDNVAVASLVITPDMQGFIDSDGNFLGRKEAKKVAFDAGQIQSTAHDDLFSEDLW